MGFTWTFPPGKAAPEALGIPGKFLGFSHYQREFGSFSTDLFCFVSFPKFLMLCFFLFFPQGVVGGYPGVFQEFSWSFLGIHSEQAGQAGGGAVLGLELDWGGSIRPRDQVVLGEAAGLDVVLEQLLGEVLVHLGGLVGIHGVATRLVQVPEQG